MENFSRREGTRTAEGIDNDTEDDVEEDDDDDEEEGRVVEDAVGRLRVAPHRRLQQIAHTSSAPQTATREN